MSLPTNSPTEMHFDPENWTNNYRELLMQIAISKVNDYQAAEDLVQDTFVSAWKARFKFRGDCSEKTFLCGVLRNKIIDFYRAKGRKPTVIASQMVSDSDDGENNWLETRNSEENAVDPTAQASRRDFMQALESAIETLPEKMRNAFRLWMMDDLTTSEVTRRLGITESNLWVSIHRAKKLLRAELGSDWDATALSAN